MNSFLTHPGEDNDGRDDFVPEEDTQESDSDITGDVEEVAEEDVEESGRIEDVEDRDEEDDTKKEKL